MTISSTGEFLATTHLGKLGIHMWSDRSYYQTVHSYPGVLNEPVDMDDPIPLSDDPSYSEEAMPSQHVDPSGAAPTSQATDASGEDTTQKQPGLVTLSGLPPTHWKTLFHLELIKERNKPIEPPKKPPSAPFFLQWRGGEALESRETVEPDTANTTSATGGDEEWAGAWSDDEAEDDAGEPIEMKEEKSITVKQRDASNQVSLPKRRKLSRHRSHLASLLIQHDSSLKNLTVNGMGFKHVSEYMATLGPSAIDLALSSLCGGSHDLEEGLPLLILASSWLTEACSTRDRFEVINAYVHRFLHLHGPLVAQLQASSREANDAAALPAEKIAELLLSIENLKNSQVAAADALREKVQNSLCLIRHLSRMV
jgi:U3 small nucleolar RNA-associated protein 21